MYQLRTSPSSYSTIPTGSDTYIPTAVGSATKKFHSFAASLSLALLSLSFFSCFLSFSFAFFSASSSFFLSLACLPLTQSVNLGWVGPVTPHSDLRQHPLSLFLPTLFPSCWRPAFSPCPLIPLCYDWSAPYSNSSEPRLPACP
jgi:hypothetical protein